jgi:hypothetical protein
MIGTLNVPPGTQRIWVSFSAEIIPNTTESLIAVMANIANTGMGLPRFRGQVSVFVSCLQSA